MRNNDPKKTPMPEQAPEVRNKNFGEVALGYTEELAITEAARCLNCKTRPCVEGCPVNVQIPDFISKIVEKDYEGAYQIVRKSNALPAVCGRVCPQETQCEQRCVRGIKGESVAIGRLERFVADHHIKNAKESETKCETNGIRVAVIGSGPAGLTCAGDLAKRGYEVTVFEAMHLAGGVLMYGIPQFRLPKEIVAREIEALKDLGVKIETNMVIGKIATLDDLREEGYEAFFIGTGAGLPGFMGIPGENLNGVYSANEFLTRINLMKAYRFPEYDTPIRIGKHVAVIGGGNVAMDAARSAKRLGAETVTVVYRRSEAEMPARNEEIHHAKEEGITFRLLCNPKEILGDETFAVSGMRCVEMELGEPDASGRRRPKEKADSEFILPIETVIMAIGQKPNRLIGDGLGDVALYEWGGISADEKGQTSVADVFAGGDAVTGAATVILAMGAGKAAAEAMDSYLKSK